MQEVKFLLREIGEGAMSSEELEEYIAYNFAAKGYELWHQSDVPVLKDGKIKSVQLLLTFVKDEGEAIVYAESGSEAISEDAPKKRGRPAKASA